MTTILIDYDLTTYEIRRIIVPESDDELIHHPPQPEHGWGRAFMHYVGESRSTLAKAALAVQAATGVWPPNVVT